MVNIKKSLMLLVWRFQQVNSMILIVGLSMTFTLQIFPHVDDWFVSIGIPRKLDWLIMLIVFIIVFACAVLCGIIYDTVLKLWIQQSIVNVERQPYAKERLKPKMVLNMRYFWMPMLKSTKCDAEAKFTTKWVEHTMKTDKTLRNDTERIIDWINEYELKPEDKRWLKQLEKVTNSSAAPKFEDIK